MKSKMVQILLLLTLLPAVSQSALAGIHHDLRVELDPAKGMLSGMDIISFDTVETPSLTLLLSNEARDVTIHSDDKRIEFTRQGDRITLLNPVSPVDISWTFHSRDSSPVQAAHHEDPTYGVFASISTRGTYLAEGSNWHPRLAEGSATHDLQVVLPTGHWAISAGALKHRESTQVTNRIHWQADYPLSGLSLAAGPWKIKEDSVEGIPVYAFFYKNSLSLAATYLDAVKNYLKLYQELFGPYPFRKFAVVENFLPTGYGFPSWTLLGSRVIKLPFIVKTSLGHEVAHSWWGNGVYADFSTGNWAEGLTTYVADYLYKEQESPEAAEAYRLKILRDYSTLVDAQAMPLQAFRSRHDKASQAIGYGKAAMVFHQIRQRIGDAAFWDALKIIADRHMFKEVGWQIFIDEFGSQSKAELDETLWPWIERGDIPQLLLSKVRNKQVEGGWAVRGQIDQLSSIYPLQVEVAIETELGQETSIISIDQAKMEFTLITKARPVKIMFDPDHHLLRRLDEREIPTTINSLRAASGLKTILSDKLTETQIKATGSLLAGMRQTLVPSAVDGQETGEPLLTSIPYSELTEDHLAPELTRHSDGQLDFRGSRIDSQTALFVVWKTDAGALRALFVPGNDQGVEHTARKIPHYGKYSYLTFIDASNQLKGIWEPAYSPLTRLLE